MTVFAVFAAIAIAFVVYFQQPECRLRGEPPCAEDVSQKPAADEAAEISEAPE